MHHTANLSRVGNWILACLGLLCVALGIVGIFVPGLPTTVFLLLASWLFAKSCPALQRRLHAHPRLGSYLQMARERRMPLRARVVSIAAIWGGISFALFTGAGFSAVLETLLLASGVTGTVAILLLGVRRPVSPSPGASLRSRLTPGLTRIQAGF